MLEVFRGKSLNFGTVPKLFKHSQFTRTKLWNFSQMGTVPTSVLAVFGIPNICLYFPGKMAGNAVIVAVYRY